MEKTNILKTIEKISLKKEYFTVADIHSFHEKISRQYISRIINSLFKEHKVLKHGKGRYVKYSLLNSVLGNHYSFNLNKKIYEVDILEKIKEKELWITELDKEAYFNFSYIFTEMVNNVIDHSNSVDIHCNVSYDGRYIKTSIIDIGVGIFQKVKKKFNLNTFYEALEKIIQGKTTTDSEHHSGEGIFFSSKIANIFSIYSSHFFAQFNNDKDDFSLQEKELIKGTQISFIIDSKNIIPSLSVFKKYTNDDHVFDTTKIILKLSQFHDVLVSRSQAKRILSGLSEKFTTIVFDYHDVDTIGQGFVDEIYRVFAKKNSQIHIENIHTNENVNFMIQRVNKGI